MSRTWAGSCCTASSARTSTGTTNSTGPVDAATGHGIVEAGQLGKLDGRRHRDLLDELTAEPDHKTLAEVFGAQPVTERTPSPQEFAAAKVNALTRTAPGTWLTYKVYDRDKRKAASVAARDLRTGRSPRCESPVCTSTPGRPRPSMVASPWRSPAPRPARARD